MIVMPPVAAELFLAIMGLIVAASGWGLAMYIKRVHERSKRER